MIDLAYEHIGRGAFCPACYADLLKTNVVRVDATDSAGDCTSCGKPSHVLLRCRYTMNGREKRRRGLL